MNMPTNSAVPPKLNRAFKPQAVAVLITLAVTIAIGAIVLGNPFRASPDPLVGVWKATDEYGGQHFYEFQKDGKMLWWDIDRDSLDKEPSKLQGVYRYEKDAIIAQAIGFIGPRVGILRRQSKDALHQDFDGHIIRQNLTYRRVMKPE